MKSAALKAPAEYQALPAKAGQAVASAQGATAVTGGVAGWSATGGTSISAGDGDTMDALSARYGVPVAALRAANGMSSGQPSAGQKIVIPSYNPSASATRVASNSQTSGTATAQSVSSSRAPRYESLQQAAPAKKEVAKKVVKTAEPPKVERKPRYESLSAAPKAASVAAAKATQEQPARKAEVKKATPTVAKVKPEAAVPKKTAKASVKQAVEDEDDQPLPPKAPNKPAKVATVGAAAPRAEPKAVAKAEAAKEETTASTEQEFRWPARGRVISGYGAKGPSGSNDGINISVPEGTPVKAAENGTVAYAGEEIKGYGKMVLIRHPNGYVSAYAHNGDLNVKRGDVVKRGQLIAKSGQTGNVTSPQLHFELRKGSEPVDPAKFLD